MVDPILRMDAGNSSVMKETVPGSVEVRYRGLHRLSTKDVISVADSKWFVTFDGPGITLTLTNGAQQPEQELINYDNVVNARGTLLVQKGSSRNLTGEFAIKWLNESKNMDILIESNCFHLMQLQPAMINIKSQKPHLFLKNSRNRYKRPVPSARKAEAMLRKDRRRRLFRG